MKIFFFTFLFIHVCLALHGQGVQLYVSPTGDDGASGSQAQPLQSLGGAVSAVRAYKGQPVTVYFADGVYPVTQKIQLTSDDSGSESAPVTYRAADGATPIFSGSKALTQWTLLTDETELSKLDASVQGKVYVTNVRDAGITDPGDPTDLGARPELFCNKQLQTLARWPNEGFAISGKAKGATIMPPSYLYDHGTVEGIFEYLDSYQDKWASEEDIRLFGYWYWNWADQYQKVATWDVANRTVYIQPPYHGYGYRDGFSYYGLNLFCEIDRPGEWYLNRTTGLLYWYPPQGIEPSAAEVVLTAFSSDYMVELVDCSNITFEGLTFREGRGTAVLIRDGKNNLLSGCRIERFGRDGVHINGGSGTNNGVSGCLLSHFGCGGMKINGGERKTLTPCNHFVEHTVIEHFSEFKRTYEPALLLTGCGMRISHNRFQYSSSSAMRLDGNDFLIEYNQISHVVMESDDQGGIDMWKNPSFRGVEIKYNYWSDINGGASREGSAAIRFDDMISGELVFGNLFERCGKGNFGAVQIHGGKDNIIDNNVFYKCHAAVSLTEWGVSRYMDTYNNDEEIQRRLFVEVDINSATYLEKYPELADITQNIDVNFIQNNLIIDCANSVLRNNRSKLKNNHTIRNAATDPAFCLARKYKVYDIQPIPLDEIGPKNNKWIEGAEPPYNPMDDSEFKNLRMDCNNTADSDYAPVLHSVQINNRSVQISEADTLVSHTVPCGENELTVTATVSKYCTYYIFPDSRQEMPVTLKPGMNRFIIRITTPENTFKDYTLEIISPLDIIRLYYGNVPAVNLNPETNGGYTFSSFQWKKNGVDIPDEKGAYLYLSSPALPADEYSVSLKTVDGQEFISCPVPSAQLQQHSSEGVLKAYPNSVHTDVTVEDEDWKQSTGIDLYDGNGTKLRTYPVNGFQTVVDISACPAGIYILRSGKSSKIIIKL